MMDTLELPFVEVDTEKHTCRSGMDMLVLTSNYTLPILLARGVLLAPSAGESSELAFLDSWGGRIPSSDCGIPGTWIMGIEQSARNAFPIALRIKKERSVRSVVLETINANFEYILLEDVDRVVFRNEREMTTFHSWEFENVPADQLQSISVVDERVFGSEEGVGTMPLPMQSSDVTTTYPSFHRVDAVGALIALITSKAAGSDSWMKGLRSMSGLSTKPAGKSDLWIVRLLSCLSPFVAQTYRDLDSAILSATVSVVMRYPLESGWPTERILNEICAEVESRFKSSKSIAQENDLLLWKESCKKVLTAKASAPDLSDNKSIVRRAVLLLLLRSDINELLNIVPGKNSGGLLVGNDVRMLALALAAMRNGLRALTRDCKILVEGQTHIDLRRELAPIFVAEYQYQFSKRAKMYPGLIEVEYTAHGPIEGEWTIKFGDRSPIIVRRHCDLNIKRIVERLKLLGVEVATEEKQVTILKDEKGIRTLSPVRISVMQGAAKEKEYIRIALEIARVNESDFGKRGKACKSIGALPKEFLIHLLKEQAKIPPGYRFELSEDEHRLQLAHVYPLESIDDGKMLGAIKWLVARSMAFPKMLPNKSNKESDLPPPKP